MHELNSEQPEHLSDSEIAYQRILGWFERKIAGAADPEAAAYYQDIMVFYESVRPTNGLQNEPFGELNEHLVEHGIRTADTDIIELAFPHVRPIKKFGLFSDMIIAARKDELLRDRLYVLGPIERIRDCLESPDTQDYLKTGHIYLYANAVLESLAAWFVTNIHTDDSSEAYESNARLVTELRIHFNHAESQIRHIASKQFESGIIPYNIIQQLSDAKSYFARLCVINNIESKFVTEVFSGKSFIHLPAMIVRAATGTITDDDRKFIRDQMRFDPRAEHDVGLAIHIVNAINRGGEFEARLIENLSNSRTSYGTTHNIITTLRWVAPDLYRKILPYLSHNVRGPSDIDDLMQIHYNGIGKAVKQGFESGLREFGATEHTSNQIIEDRYERAFWYGLFLAGSPHLREQSRTEGENGEFVLSKDRVIHDVRLLVESNNGGTDEPKKSVEWLVQSLVDDFPNTDAVVLIHGLLDVVEVLADTEYSDATIIKYVVSVIHPSYHTLLNRRSKHDATVEIKARIKQMQENFDEPKGSGRLHQLGLDWLSNIFIKSLVRNTEEAAPIDLGGGSYL